MKFIVPHAGATLPVLADRVAAFASVLPAAERSDSRPVMETLASLYYDVAGFSLPRQLPALQTLVPASQLLYGSDWPFTPEPVVERLLGQLESFVNQVDVDDNLQGLWRGNAGNLFPHLANLRD